MAILPKDAPDGASWAAAAVTLLFALNPSHVEAVVWIAGRKDVLSGMFSLLALWLALRARRPHGGFSAPWATATLVALLAAIYSKATAISVAAIVSLLWLMFWYAAGGMKGSRRALLWPLSSLLLAICAAMTFAAITTQRIPFHFGGETITRALAILGWLARLSFSPEGRHFYYPLFEYSWLPAMAALGAVVFVAALWGGVAVFRNRPLEGFALLAFMLLCLPSLQLVPYRPPSPVSDRFIFLAVWPAMLLLVSVCWRLRPLLRMLILLAIALSWLPEDIKRPRDWQSFERVAKVDEQAYPDSLLPTAYTIMLIQLPGGLHEEAMERASRITSPEIRDAMTALVRAERAVHLAPASDAMKELTDWGQTLRQPFPGRAWDTSLAFVLDKLTGALVEDWRVLAGRFPADAGIHYSAGMYLLSLNTQYREAAAYFRVALASPELPPVVRSTAHKNLGIALLGNKQFAEAETALRAALGQSPQDQEAHCVLAVVYAREGEASDATREQAACPDRSFRVEMPK